MVKRAILWLMMCILFAIPVRAEETGSIRLAMRYHGQAVSGGTVKLYDISNISPVTDPEEMVKLLSSMGIDGEVQNVGNDGRVYFSGLKTGCYLVVQEQAPDGYYAMKPFMVSVPITVDGRIQYEIDAFPKLEKIPEEKLPQTGQMNLPVWVLTGGGLLMLSLGIWMRKEN